MVVRADVTHCAQATRRESNLEERVAEAVSTARAAVAPSQDDDRELSDPRAQLNDLARRLGEKIKAVGPSDVATTDLLNLVLQLRCEQLDHELERRVKSLSELRSALGSLRGLPPREMLEAAPVVLSRELAFSRTMISTVRGSLWLPQYLHIADAEVDAYSRSFHRYVPGVQINLADAPLETELIRKRCGAIVPEPRDDKRTFKEIIEVSGCRGYVAAPITVQGKVIGMLHADRPEPDGVVTTEHLEQLEAFAECLAVVFESAVQAAKAAQQRLEVENLCSDLDAPLNRTGRTSLWSIPTAATELPLDYRRGQQSTPVVLTAREREIMSHVATGATNSQIARCLVISEGTVKSHLKHIAKKLNTSSRAAAVAVYSGLVGVADSR